MDSTAMRVFDSGEFGQVRTVMRDGAPWFVAADVCRVLWVCKVMEMGTTITKGH